MSTAALYLNGPPIDGGVPFSAYAGGSLALLGVGTALGLRLSARRRPYAMVASLAIVLLASRLPSSR